MWLDSPWMLPAGGLIIGFIMGFTARRLNFCTLSSLERHWYANDSVALRMWILAIAVAIASTQLLQFFDVIDLGESFILRPSFNLPAAITGGVMFGIGMALTGTCGFGALVRLGSGSLRSLVVVVAIGLAALTTQRGILGYFREAYIEPLSINLSWAGSQSMAAIASSILGINANYLIATLIVSALLYWTFRSHEFRRSYRFITAGIIIGLCVTAGWLITYIMQQRTFDVVTLESASFVLPTGTLIMHLLAVYTSIPGYVVCLAPGVVVGAALSASLTKDVRWEACDDASEFGRHLIGAMLMGIGGVLAGGCTIGQGISASSTLAISAPVVFFSIMLGARMGLSWLLEGSAIGFIRGR